MDVLVGSELCRSVIYTYPLALELSLSWGTSSFLYCNIVSSASYMQLFAVITRVHI